MAATKKLEDRLKGIESAIETIMERLVKIEEKVDSIEPITRKVDEAADKLTIQEIVVNDKIKEISDETDIKITSSELRCEEKITDIGKQLKELVDKTVAIELKVEEINEGWPTPKEAFSQDGPWQIVKRKNTKLEKPIAGRQVQQKRYTSGSDNDISMLSKKCYEQKDLGNSCTKTAFSDKCKDKDERTFVVIGDSMARGVGSHLQADNNMFSKLDFGGAKIEDLTEKIRTIGERPGSNAVVMIGTNNLIYDKTESIMKKYDSLLDELKDKKYKDIIIVGMVKRANVSDYTESKRIGLNQRIKKLCERKGAGFLEVDIDKETMLDRKGVHLNYKGQERVARSIFKHCINYLN